MKNNLSFDQIPSKLYDLGEKVEQIFQLLNSKEFNSSTKDNDWLDLNELVKYDPEKRSKPTFYGYVSNNEIPFHKRGKKLIFLKSEIDAWLKTGRKKTIEEIETEAENYLSNK